MRCLEPQPLHLKMEPLPNTIGCVGTSLVVASSSQCPQDPCPFCHLNLRHDCSEKDILHRCRDFTGNTRFQLRTLVGQYVSFSVAARSILSDMGSTAKLPVEMSLQECLSLTFLSRYYTGVWEKDGPLQISKGSAIQLGASQPEFLRPRQQPSFRRTELLCYTEFR